MKTRNVLAVSISLILTAPVLAQSPGESKANQAPKARPAQPVFMPAADLKWTDLDPKGAPGVKVANLWGDHAKGAFGAVLQASGGIRGPTSHAHPRHEGRVHIRHVPSRRRKARRRHGSVRGLT